MFRMQTFQDTFETRRRSFIGAFSICMTVPLRIKSALLDPIIKITFSALAKEMRTSNFLFHDECDDRNATKDEKHPHKTIYKILMPSHNETVYGKK